MTCSPHISADQQYTLPVISLGRDVTGRRRGGSRLTTPCVRYKAISHWKTALHFRKSARSETQATLRYTRRFDSLYKSDFAQLAVLRRYCVCPARRSPRMGRRSSSCCVRGRWRRCAPASAIRLYVIKVLMLASVTLSALVLAVVAVSHAGLHHLHANPATWDSQQDSS